MKRKIIVFPASKWQCDLIKYLKRKNYFVYSLDDDNNAIGHNFSSKRLNINSKEIKKIRSFVKRNKCKIISSCSDTGQKLVNKVNNKSNILFNKYNQRLIQKKLKFDIPFFKKDLATSNDLKKFKKIILKPIYGSGSKNIFIIEKSKKKVKRKNYIFEEFIDGEEFNVDGFFYNKKFYLYAIMKKRKINNSLTVSYIMKSNILNEKIINNLKNNLNSFFSKSKYPNGPVHAEVLTNKKDKKIFIVESHPREAGFDLYYKLCKKITGLNLISNTVNAKLGKKLKEIDLKSKNKFKYFCMRMIPMKKKGEIKNIYFSKLKKNKNIQVSTDLFVKPGDKVEYKSNDASRLGSIMCVSNRISNLEKYTLSILKKYFVLKYN